MRWIAVLTLTFLFSFTSMLRSEVLDRIAITIDQGVITESQIDEELRVTSFLNRKPAQWSVEDRRAAGDRLIQQALVEREMKLGHYPPPTDQEVQRYFNGLVASMDGPSQFAANLNRMGLDAETLKSHLGLQLTALRFIEYRFRPNFEITDEEIAAYRKQTPEATTKAAIRETLVQQRTDSILGAWLEESRKQVNIVYLDPSLQ